MTRLDIAAGKSPMIEINLLPGAGKKESDAPQDRRLRRDRRRRHRPFRDKFLIGAVVAVVAGIGAGASACSTRSRPRARRTLTERQERALRDSTRYANFLKDRYRAEATRDTLLRQVQRHPQPRRGSLRLAARARRGEPRASAVHVAHAARRSPARRRAATTSSSRRRRRRTRRPPPRRRTSRRSASDTAIPQGRHRCVRVWPHGRHPGGHAIHERSRSVAVPHERAAREVRARASSREKKSRSSS